MTGNKFNPLLIFKENASIVDTPGIGESREMTAKLLDYLSEAVAFIYVINTTNGGGVQNDKVILLYWRPVISGTERLKDLHFSYQYLHIPTHNFDLTNFDLFSVSFFK